MTTNEAPTTPSVHPIMQLLRGLYWLLGEIAKIIVTVCQCIGLIWFGIIVIWLIRFTEFMLIDGKWVIVLPFGFFN